MANGLPTTAKIGVPGKAVNIDTATYFLATRMEKCGMLHRGQALMLAATLPNISEKPQRGAKRSKRK